MQAGGVLTGTVIAQIVLVYSVDDVTDASRRAEISRNGSCTADGRRRYVQQRRLAARGAVKLVPLISSVYRPYFGRCGLLWPTGSAPGNASLAKSLPNPD